MNEVHIVKHYYIVKGKVVSSKKEITEHDKKLHGKLIIEDGKYQLHVSISNYTKVNIHITQILEYDKDFIKTLENYERIPVYIRHVNKLFDINELSYWIEGEVTN